MLFVYLVLYLREGWDALGYYANKYFNYLLVGNASILTIITSLSFHDILSNISLIATTLMAIVALCHKSYSWYNEHINRKYKRRDKNER